MIQDSDKIVIPPNWSAIIFAAVCFGGVCYGGVRQVDLLYEHGPWWFLAIMCLVGIFFFWKKIELCESGLVYSRCGIYRRSIPWSNIVQIALAMTDTPSEHNVIVIVLRNIRGGARFIPGEPLGDFHVRYRGYVFVIDPDFYGESSERLYEFIETHWGPIERTVF